MRGKQGRIRNDRTALARKQLGKNGATEKQKMSQQVQIHVVYGDSNRRLRIRQGPNPVLTLFVSCGFQFAVNNELLRDGIYDQMCI